MIEAMAVVVAADLMIVMIGVSEVEEVVEVVVIDLAVVEEVEEVMVVVEVEVSMTEMVTDMVAEVVVFLLDLLLPDFNSDAALRHPCEDHHHHEGAVHHQGGFVEILLPSDKHQSIVACCSF